MTNYKINNLEILLRLISLNCSVKIENQSSLSEVDSFYCQEVQTVAELPPVDTYLQQICNIY